MKRTIWPYAFVFVISLFAFALIAHPQSGVTPDVAVPSGGSKLSGNINQACDGHTETIEPTSFQFTGFVSVDNNTGAKCSMGLRIVQFNGTVIEVTAMDGQSKVARGQAITSFSVTCSTGTGNCKGKWHIVF
jgi:hypothetical protein